MRNVIAIDGPSGSGKTTIAKCIAGALGYRYLDTGALYRAVAFFLRRQGISPDDSDDRIGEILSGVTVAFGDERVIINGEDVTGALRSKEIDHFSSVFSAKKSVRQFLLSVQREAARHDDLVIEGRDTTTVIFPDARKKIYLDATLEERARRRYHQYRERGIEISLEEAIRAIRERDERDGSREIAPLVKAPDAFFIDSSGLTVEEVKRAILTFVREDP